MDTLILVPLILGLLKYSNAQGTEMLRCIECEHIGWNMTYTFDGVQNVYQLLQSKYNPACTAYDPRNPNMYDPNYQNQQNQQQFQNTNPNQMLPGDNFFQNRNKQISDTICPVFADTNRCSYVHGIAEVHLESYNAKMNLAMHVRNCINADAAVENMCYRRDTQYGNNMVRNFLQEKLQFLGGATVTRFVGAQCYCNSDFCHPEVSSGRNVMASWCSLVLALIALIFFN